MKWFIPFLAFIGIARADSVLPVPEETRSRYMPDDSTLSGEYEYKKRYNSEAEKNAQLQDEVNKARDALTAKLKSGALTNAEPQSGKPTKASGGKKRLSRGDVDAFPINQPPQFNSTPLLSGVEGVQSFHISKSEFALTTLPMGAFVRIKVLSGVESANEPLPMLVQLEDTFVGPNHTRIDLRHCMMMSKARGNLSNERVYAETTEISCIRDNGEYVKRPARGYIVGEDSTFGAIGPIVSKKGQAIAAAAGLSAIKGIGEAVGLTESSSQTLSTGSVIEKSAAVTGNKLAFIGGKAGMEAATLLTQEAIEQARQFQSAVALGSGRNLWVVMLDSVEIPALGQSEESED